MKGYEIQELSDPAVLLIKMDEDFNDREVIAAYQKELYAYYDKATSPVYQVVDALELKMEFGLILELIQQGLRSETAITKHPKHAGLIIVTQSRFHHALLKGLNTASFGYIKIEAFDSVDAALNWIRQQAA